MITEKTVFMMISTRILSECGFFEWIVIKMAKMMKGNVLLILFFLCTLRPYISRAFLHEHGQLWDNTTNICYHQVRSVQGHQQDICSVFPKTLAYNFLSQ